MNDDPAAALRNLAASMRTDPDLPPGVVVMRPGTEQIARTVSHPGGLVTDELWEDVQSFLESFPYLIRMSKRGEPIRCECCGTLVALTPEARRAGGRWILAIWEFKTLRKHTLRRCEWMRPAVRPARAHTGISDALAATRHLRGICHQAAPGRRPRSRCTRRRAPAARGR